MKLLALFSLLTASWALSAEPTALHLADFDNGSGKAAGPGWSETDGVIHLAASSHDKKAAAQGGNLISKQSYTSFQLEWDWKVAVGGNNGIKYWVTKVGGKEWLGIEYQMIDDAKHPDATKKDSRSTACIYDIKAAAKNKPVKPAGEWNSSKVVVQGSKIQHWLNGSLVCEADTAAPEWKDLISQSKFKGKDGFAPGAGHLMLTDHSDETWLKNIRVTPLQ
jgi:hypothetical protein